MADGLQKKAKLAFPRRGDIYLVAFDPAVGHEIKKTRPALIIQNDLGNEYSSTTIVAAFTSRVSTNPYPIEVVIDPMDSGLRVRSTVRLDQVRTVDRQRLLKRIGKASPDVMEQVNLALQISFALID